MVIMLSVSKHVVVLLIIYFQFHIQSAFSRLLTAGAITPLPFRKLKQITIKGSLSLGKTYSCKTYPKFF